MSIATFARTDHSLFSQWWWTIDRWLLISMGLLVAMGTLLIAAASPPVAERIGLSPYYFINRHLILLLPSLFIMLGVSLLSPQNIRRLALAILGVAIILTALTSFIGMEIKGARRWIHFPGFSLQPSEFIKPAFAVVSAWLLTQHKLKPGFPGNKASLTLFVLCCFFLLLQPDLGMTIVLTAIWGMQVFLAGLPFLLVGVLAGLAGLAITSAYFLFPHVQSRIDRFMNPASGDTFQVERSLEAFMNGGLFGTGPGQGTVKMLIPDAHADFVFSVAGEELGLIFCLLLVALFAFIVLRGFLRVLSQNNLFSILAVGGLLAQFGLQALINMGSALHMIPTKGMTMPFVSYGGSSLLALSLGMGMVFALTRKRSGESLL